MVAVAAGAGRPDRIDGGGFAVRGNPGWLKARFDASEIVTSLMLNFVAASMAAWVIFEVYPEGFVQRTKAIHVSASSLAPWKAL